MRANAFEEVAQVGEGVDAEFLRSRDETGEHGRNPSPVVAAQEHPIFSTYRDSAQAALGAVVVDLQIAVLTVADQRLPV